MDEMASHSPSPAQSKRRRVGEACIVCRARKSKCDGLIPTCSYCRTRNVLCKYISDAHHGRESSYVRDIEERLQQMEESFKNSHDTRKSSRTGSERRESSPGHDDSERVGHQRDPATRLSSNVDFGKRIVSGSSQLDADTSPSNKNTNIRSGSKDGFAYSDGADAIEASRDIITPDIVDGMVSMPPIKSKKRFLQANNYFGASSNISLLEQILRTIAPEGPSNLVSDIITNHAPTIELASSTPADPYCIPAPATALDYFDIYFNYGHTLYPFINERAFRAEFQSVLINGPQSTRPTWLAMMNVIIALAIVTGSKDHQTGEDRTRESVIYIRRVEGLIGANVLGAETFEWVQLLLLKAQYLQGTHYSILCWNIVGLAIRIAQGLGLHNPHTYEGDDVVTREYKNRTWSMCYQLDRILAMTFGRPSIIKGTEPTTTQCDVQGETAFQDQAGRKVPFVSLFTATTSMMHILGNGLESLYDFDGKDENGRINPLSLSRKVDLIISLETRLESWRLALPEAIRPNKQGTVVLNNGSHSSLQRFAVILGLRYHNLRVLLHRSLLLPALSDHFQRENRVSNSEDSYEMLRCIAQCSGDICVSSATSVIHIVMQASQVKPKRQLLGAWWFSLYYVFNASLVIFANLFTLLSSSSRPQSPMSEEVKKQKHFFDQGFHFIKDQAHRYRSAERCYQFLKKLLETLRPTRSQQTSNTPLTQSAMFPPRGTQFNLDTAVGRESSNSYCMMESLDMLSDAAQQIEQPIEERSIDNWDDFFESSIDGFEPINLDSWKWLLTTDYASSLAEYQNRDILLGA